MKLKKSIILFKVVATSLYVIKEISGICKLHVEQFVGEGITSYILFKRVFKTPISLLPKIKGSPPSFFQVPLEASRGITASGSYSTSKT